jgi:hypothetical protein
MKKIFILMSLLFILVPLFSEIILNHEQPLNLENGKKIILDIEIREGFSDIEKVTIFFKQTGETAYSEKEMEAGSESNPIYSLIMSEFIGYSSNAEYYFEVQTKAGNIITHPSIQPEMNPLRITVYIPQDVNDGFVLLSPDAAYSNVTKNLLIAISIFAISDEIDHNSINVFFDGKDVTSESRIFTNALIYQVPNVKYGIHTYYVTAKLLNGSIIESEHWITSIKEKGFERPLNLSGRALLSMRYMNTSYDTLDNSDKSANFLLTFKDSHQWLRFKSKIYLSSLETSSAQAVNKYSLAFNVPYFDLTIGDHTPKMNSFLLNCKNVQGIHTKLDFKSFCLMYTRGNLKRSVDGKVIQDTLLIHSGTFKQTNNSLRIELGNPQSFVMGFGFAKNKDDIGSLDERYYRNLDDSLLVVSPKDNLVFGTDFRLSLMNKQLIIGTEAAMSLYNSNIIDGTISLDDFDEDIELPLNIDPMDFESIFIINEFMIPYKPGMASVALKSYLRLFFYRNLLNISFTNIGSSFNSLSTNYHQKDIMIMSFNDNLMLMNNKLALNFGFNLSSDNVDDTKDNTSTSTSFFTQAMYKPNDKIYFNLNFNTSGYKDGFVPDSTDYENTATDIRSTSFSFGTGYLVKQIKNAPTRFSLNFSNSLNKDEANNTYEYQRNNVTLSAKTAFEQLPIKTLFSYTFTLNDNSVLVDTLTSLEKSNYNSILLRGEFDLMKSQLKPYIDFRYNFFNGDIDSQSAKMFNIGSSYKITSNFSISVAAGLKMYQNLNEPNSDYSRLNFKMKISQKF